MTENKDFLQKKFPIPTQEEEDIEQAVSLIWQLNEQGRESRADITSALLENIGSGVQEILSARGLIRENLATLRLSESGSLLASNIVRRRRLTERLLRDILDMPPGRLDADACRLEHVVSRDVEEAICTLLGHPRECPHGCPIPKGRCCQKELEQTGPVVCTLQSMGVSQEGRVVYLSLQNRPELHKLLSLGLAPGAKIRVVQTSPAVVVSIGETLLALDSRLSDNVFIRKGGT